jgi:hypothetical protein
MPDPQAHEPSSYSGCGRLLPPPPTRRLRSLHLPPTLTEALKTRNPHPHPHPHPHPPQSAAGAWVPCCPLRCSSLVPIRAAPSEGAPWRRAHTLDDALSHNDTRALSEEPPRGGAAPPRDNVRPPLAPGTRPQTASPKRPNGDPTSLPAYLPYRTVSPTPATPLPQKHTVVPRGNNRSREVATESNRIKNSLALWPKLPSIPAVPLLASRNIPTHRAAVQTRHRSLTA